MISEQYVLLLQQNNVLKLRDATGKPETGFPLPQLSMCHGGQLKL
jgi:hypothetical protein